MQKQTEEELQVFRNTYKTYGLDDTSVQALENLTRSGRTDYQVSSVPQDKLSIFLISFKLIAATVSFILSNKNDGAVLIFLSGAQEIKQCIEAIKSFLGTSVEILPLHANLNSDEQRKVFKKSDKRKIIVSTNVAEVSSGRSSVTDLIVFRPPLQSMKLYMLLIQGKLRKCLMMRILGCHN